MLRTQQNTKLGDLESIPIIFCTILLELSFVIIQFLKLKSHFYTNNNQLVLSQASILDFIIGIGILQLVYRQYTH